LIPFVISGVVGLLAGAYPAFILSSLKSIDSLKGKLTTVKENVLLRKSLIAFQFSLALIVLVAAIIVTQQVNYFFSKQLGYDKEYIVSAQAPRDWTREGVNRMLTIRNELASLPQVSSVSLSYEIPDGNNAGQVPVYKWGADSTSATFLQLLRTDETFLDTYKIPMVAGSFFKTNGTDSGSVVINEKTMALLGYKDAEQILDQKLSITGDPTIFTVKGVVKDFAFGSMHQPIAPMLFFNVRFSPLYRYLSFKIRPGDISSTIAAIEKKWSVLLPGSSFEYKFMDDTLKNLYKTEIQLKKASYTATILSLLVALLGVLGLVSLSIQKRTKEIGIRKVLGASVRSITALFMKEILIVVLVAGLIACPLAWMIMHRWLEDYAYRVVLTPKPFILSIAALAMITVILITLQTVKAGRSNPGLSLRTE
jgi:ABC-type antimicrobial peptide transport system permease subunit